jgi:hypothetical protein
MSFAVEKVDGSDTAIADRFGTEPRSLDAARGKRIFACPDPAVNRLILALSIATCEKSADASLQFAQNNSKLRADGGVYRSQRT